MITRRDRRSFRCAITVGEAGLDERCCCSCCVVDAGVPVREPGSRDSREPSRPGLIVPSNRLGARSELLSRSCMFVAVLLLLVVLFSKVCRSGILKEGKREER